MRTKMELVNESFISSRTLRGGRQTPHPAGAGRGRTQAGGVQGSHPNERDNPKCD